MSENNQQLIHFYWDGPGLYAQGCRSHGDDIGGGNYVVVRKVADGRDARQQGLGFPKPYNSPPSDAIVHVWRAGEGWIRQTEAKMNSNTKELHMPTSPFSDSDLEQARRPATPYITYPTLDWLTQALMSLVDESGERVLVVADHPGFLFDTVRREVSGCKILPTDGRREARPLLFSDQRVRCLFVQPFDVTLGLPLKDFDVVIVVGIFGGSHVYEQIKRKVNEPQRLILVGTTFLMPLEANNAS